MDKIFNLKVYGEDYKIRLEKTSYSNNNSLAIEMEVLYENGEVEPWDSLTTNLPESISNNEKFAFVNDAKYGVFLRDNKIAEPTGRISHSGFNTYSEYDFSSLFHKKDL